MYYAPHTYRFRHPETLGMDEFGRPVKTGETEWIEGGDCRCDDNSVQEFTDDNGRVYRPAYKVVVDRWTEIEAGDTIEVYTKEGMLRGQGKVYNVIRCNYLNYSTVWV